MIRCISKVAKSTLSRSPLTKLAPFPPQPPRRFLYAEINVARVIPSYHEMIQYALSIQKSEKTEEKFAESMLLLEQCLSQQSEDEEDQDLRLHNTKGMCMLAMANILYAKGEYIETMDKLRKVQEFIKSTLDLRVAALEALAGVGFEIGRDDTGRVIEYPCVDYLMRFNSCGTRYCDARAEGVKGFVNLVLGNLEAAESNFKGFQFNDRFVVPTVLTYGELLHVKQNFSLAKDVYTKIIEAYANKREFTRDFIVTYGLAACGMASEEALMATTCALGQVEAHMGNFDVAEEMLTKALTMAENLYGSNHPKVGVILTCLALMFKHKAVKERSSSLLIQEGLFRRALDYLKAPPVDSEDFDAIKGKRDIMALARGGYAEALCVQENRKSEGEKMRAWAEAAWSKNRLTLDEALKFSESSDKVAVVDTRCCRVL